MVPIANSDSTPTAAEAAIHELLLELAARLEAQLPSLTEVLQQAFDERIPELPHDPLLLDLLRGSTSGNLGNLVHLVRGHMPQDQIQVPASAEEYARRLAQRETPTSALLRAYRLGQQLVLRWGRDEIAALTTDPLVALEVNHRFTEITFIYVDAVSEGVMSAYQDERDRWLANRRTVQREAVEVVLRGEPVELDEIEKALGYRLRQHHLGVVLWTAADDSAVAARRTADLGRMEKVLGRVARAVRAKGHPLFAARDSGTAWGWIPLGRSGEALLDAIADVLAAEDELHLAVGSPGVGLVGFRTTHLEALGAQRVATAGHLPQAEVCSYGEPGVRAAALLASDLEATRRLVSRALGGLAEDDESAARLRETVLAFIGEKDSYVATSARMHLHKNTVKYRIQRAAEARGRSLDEDRLDLELALHAAAWLGTRVLPGRRED